MNDTDVEILVSRGMSVRDAAIYDGCTLRAAHDAMARYMFKSGYKPTGRRGRTMNGGPDRDSVQSVCDRYGMDKRLFWASWAKVEYWANVEKEARKNARKATG